MWDVQLLFLAGVSVTIGHQATLKFFKKNPKVHTNKINSETSIGTRKDILNWVLSGWPPQLIVPCSGLQSNTSLGVLKSKYSMSGHQFVLVLCRGLLASWEDCPLSFMDGPG